MNSVGLCWALRCRYWLFFVVGDGRFLLGSVGGVGVGFGGFCIYGLGVWRFLIVYK